MNSGSWWLFLVQSKLIYDSAILSIQPSADDKPVGDEELVPPPLRAVTTSKQALFSELHGTPATVLTHRTAHVTFHLLDHINRAALPDTFISLSCYNYQHFTAPSATTWAVLKLSPKQ
jgi:hypothetical protein